jgi:choline dehydrogenase-like flavoprotein/pimeloyl-ACP methyl ester carboxylesterase
MADPELPAPGEHDFDVVIVGSGYGGAVAASELSACRNAKSKNAKSESLKICVLERGKEYLAGMFPSRLADLAGYARFATPNAKRQRGVYDGLYDIRWSNDVVAVVASGVGGGSLINAGVMEMPRKEVFQETRWPKAIRDDDSLCKLSDSLLHWLGAGKLTVSNFNKGAALEKLSGANGTRPLHVSVTPPKEDEKEHPKIKKNVEMNAAGVPVTACNRCGDCATGCNHNAKQSLDRNLLRLAQKDGTRIVTGATVLSVAPADSWKGWLVEVNHTDAHLRDRQRKPFNIRAKRVILAAGTFGSTEILMRSKKLRLSSHLGRNFSANGDMIAAVHDLKGVQVIGVADETKEPKTRGVGPTITGMIDLRTGEPETDVVIQDLAVPGPLRRLFEESFTTTDVLNRLVEDESIIANGGPMPPDDAAVESKAFDRSLVVAMIGRDTAEGELRAGQSPIAPDADGMLTVSWPELRRDDRFAKHHKRLDGLLRDAGLGGRVLKNPMWNPLSDRIEGVFGAQRGPMVTVHPLGGCNMADDVRKGVTDHCGRVFDESRSSPTATYDGLVVLDGSIVPTSLGINPALTIAVLALRAIIKLKEKWELQGGRLTRLPPNQLQDDRPDFSVPFFRADPTPTKIELTEQMTGVVNLRGSDGEVRPHMVEVTLTTEPARIADLISHEAPEGRILKVPRATNGRALPGRLRILHAGKTFDPISHEPDEKDVAVIAEVSGKIRLFGISRPRFRVVIASWAWLRNRGLRDIAQASIQYIRQKLRMIPSPASRPQRLSHRLSDMLRLLSRAGSVRLIEYDFRIDSVVRSDAGVLDGSKFEQQPIHGLKRLTYARCSSPWAQLMEMTLDTFPGMVSGTFLQPGMQPILKFNPRYTARKVVPLFRVVDQQDRVAALIDLLSFGLYLLRILLQVHALSFRMPDAPADRAPQRLPGALPGIPAPQVDWVVVDRNRNPPAYIRLARYDGRLRSNGTDAPGRPVLLIHGYSASGTTFAHPAVKGNLVQKLYEDGRDVWVLDMRSSAGLTTAVGDWAFEDMALNDIPIAIKHIRAAYGGKRRVDGGKCRVDIVAHCMGGAMFSMAVLSERDRNGDPNKLYKKIGRVVFSQVGPVMMLSPANVLAAYVMRYVRHFVPLEKYEFSPQGDMSLAGQVLDRALAAIPMPRNEFLLENPLWPPGKATPWVGTRHRMDALYSRTFSLANLPKPVLDHIDDFFGPLSVFTVSQVIHFAGFNTVTDHYGINKYVTPQRVREQLMFPMMAIHGVDNGLVDVATLALMRNIVVVRDDAREAPYLNESWNAVEKCQDASAIEQVIDGTDLKLGEASLLTWRIRDHGHQDCLIGKDAERICGGIAKYLGRPDAQEAHAKTELAASSLDHAQAGGADGPRPI